MQTRALNSCAPIFYGCNRNHRYLVSLGYCMATEHQYLCSTTDRQTEAHHNHIKGINKISMRYKRMSLYAGCCRKNKGLLRRAFIFLRFKFECISKKTKTYSFVFIFSPDRTAFLKQYQICSNEQVILHRHYQEGHQVYPKPLL